MAEVFPVIPEELPAQTADSIGRSPAFVFREDGREGTFTLVDGAVREVTGAAAVRQWLELMLRQVPGKVPIYRTDGTTQPGIAETRFDRSVPDGWVYAEIERNVRETASFCPAIRTVDSFDFSRRRRGVEVRFTAHLRTGESEEVTAYVGE